LEQTGDLTVTLKRGNHRDTQQVGSQDGIVLIRLAIYDYDGVAVVELEPSHSLGNDNLATAEAALAHLQTVVGRLRAFQSLEAAS
jgi:hypothetical protein